VSLQHRKVYAAGRERGGDEPQVHPELAEDDGLQAAINSAWSADAAGLYRTTQPDQARVTHLQGSSTESSNDWTLVHQLR
jgi:hypothetical protein